MKKQKHHTGNYTKNPNPYSQTITTDWLLIIDSNNPIAEDHVELIEENNPISFSWWDLYLENNPDMEWLNYRHIKNAK